MGPDRLLAVRIPTPLIEWAEQEAARLGVDVVDIVRDGLEVIRQLTDGTPSEASERILQDAIAKLPD